jgi:serine phosphatase RsbU (regulator of sigma subunit)
LEGEKVQFDSLADRNTSLKEEIQALEKDVAEYEEALTTRDRARGEQERTDETIAGDLEELRALFTYRRDIQRILLLTDQRLKALEKLNLSTG